MYPESCDLNVLLYLTTLHYALLDRHLMSSVLFGGYSCALVQYWHSTSQVVSAIEISQDAFIAFLQDHHFSGNYKQLSLLRNHNFVNGAIYGLSRNEADVCSLINISNFEYFLHFPDLCWKISDPIKAFFGNWFPFDNHHCGIYCILFFNEFS